MKYEHRYLGEFVPDPILAAIEKYARDCPHCQITLATLRNGADYHESIGGLIGAIIEARFRAEKVALDYIKKAPPRPIVILND